METEERQELEGNDLGNWLSRWASFVRPHLSMIVVAAVVALCISLVVSYRNSLAAQAKAAAWDEFASEDYEAIVKNLPDSEAAKYARVRLADKAAEEGKQNLLLKRDEALKAFERAIGFYGDLASDSSAPEDLRRQAAFGKAAALESRGAPEKAIEAYKTVVGQYRDSAEARKASSRIKELGKKSAIDFYRQLVDYKPESKTPMPGGSDLDFDFLKDFKKNGVDIPVPPPVKPTKAAEPTPKPPMPPPSAKTETKAPAAKTEAQPPGVVTPKAPADAGKTVTPPAKGTTPNPDDAKAAKPQPPKK